MNGLCGFSAIILTSRGLDTAWIPPLLPNVSISFFALAGYMIFLGMVADMMDGHVARISKTTSSFGAQLDSLCDVITFGVAPAFLMLKLIEVYAPQLLYGNELNAIFGRAIILIAIIYTMCAIIRLARFNVENKEDEAVHLGFAGLPSPAAAGMIVSMVIFHQDFLPKIAEWTNLSLGSIELTAVWVLPIVTLIAGFLMVSRIPYPHIMNRLLRGKKRFSTFLLVAFILLLTILNIQLAMTLGFTVYAFYGIIRWLVQKGREQRTANRDCSLSP
jgi:CDP-diacylglycerol--serine O-phosphatidyltransferase